jgi:D-sedoheptulose 7-phosphate isomerase
MTSPSVLDGHLAGLASALVPYRQAACKLAHWGGELATLLAGGGRLLVAGNGGSAAEAQHLTAELVGKLRDDRRPLSAIALTAETSSLTAIGNDFGYEEVFARQVRAHGRPDDVLLLMSTSGRSRNLLAAAEAGTDAGLRVLGLTGPSPNPLAELCSDVLAVPSPDPQVVQELHLVSVHVLCEHVDLILPALREPVLMRGRA